MTFFITPWLAGWLGQRFVNSALATASPASQPSQPSPNYSHLTPLTNSGTATSFLAAQTARYPHL
jgi:hypothetical protein